MSFVAPTSNVIAITSGAQIIASGTITITLNLRNAANFASNSFTMDVTDIGTLEIDFNYIEDIGDINDFTINVPSFEFEMLDSIKDSSLNTESFVGAITSLDAADLIVAKVDFNSKSDYYYTTREQCEFSYSERKVKLKMQHPMKYGAIGFGKTWDSNVFTGKTVTLVDAATGGSATTLDAVYPKDLISLYLPIISESSDLYFDSELYSSNSSTSPSSGQEEILIPTARCNGFSSASTVVRELALTESAIIGNVLGNAYYTPRFKKNTSEKATLSSDDFEELDLDYSFRNVRYFFFNYEIGDDTEGTATPNVNTNGQVLINEFGRSNVNVDYQTLTSLFPAEWDGTSQYEFGLSQYDQIGSSFQSNVIASYQKIFRISDNNVDAGIAISGTILGIDKLKPYQYFSVSSGVHPLVNGKDFRPSYLKFNLLDDTIEFEAYEF